MRLRKRLSLAHKIRVRINCMKPVESRVFNRMNRVKTRVFNRMKPVKVVFLIALAATPRYVRRNNQASELLY